MTVVAVDMRSWQAPEQADILVSELLGSFGDNELSPECLDGAQRFLKSEGISIPCAYTSHLQPITSAKLWSEVQVCLEPQPQKPCVLRSPRTQSDGVPPFSLPLCITAWHENVNFTLLLSFVGDKGGLLGWENI